MANSLKAWNGRPITASCSLCGRYYFADVEGADEDIHWHQLWCRAIKNMPAKVFKTGHSKGNTYGQWSALGKALDYSGLNPGAPVWQAWDRGRKPRGDRARKLELLAAAGPMTSAFLKALEKIKK